MIMSINKVELQEKEIDNLIEEEEDEEGEDYQESESYHR